MNGVEMRASRKARRLTQEQLANLLRVSQSMVAQMEAGTRPIPAREREIAQDVVDPSISEELHEIFAISEEELREEVGDAAPRGPYGA